MSSTTRHEPTWQTTAHARRLVTLAALALIVGLAIGRPDLAALAAVPMAFLGRRPVRRPDTITLSSSVPATCFEHEPVRLVVRAESSTPVDVLLVTVAPAAFAEHAGGPPSPRIAVDAAALDLSATLAMTRWGRRSPARVTVAVTADAGLRRAVAAMDADELSVFPRPEPLPALSMPAARRGLSGDHRARSAGSGVEVVDVRPYSIGDPPSRVNWAASARLQQLHVTDRAAEHAVDVVVVLDTLSDVGPAGTSSMDLSVRGATGLARSLLRSHDRVGVVALGGWLRWLTPDTGERQFYRVAASMLDVLDRESYVDPDVTRLPPAAVPSGAQVVMFSPLLDGRALRAVEQLRGRGVAVTVVDVLNVDPPARSATEQLAVRLWRLDREATGYALAGLGVLVVPWDGAVPLDVTLAPALRRPHHAVAR